MINKKIINIINNLKNNSPKQMKKELHKINKENKM